MTPRGEAELKALNKMANDRCLNVESRAAALLTAHQRMEAGGPCICGWNRLGGSHAVHVTEKLREAGLLKED